MDKSLAKHCVAPPVKDSAAKEDLQLDFGRSGGTGSSGLTSGFGSCTIRGCTHLSFHL